MSPPKVLVCNIGWMSRYEGLRKQPDRIVGGGSYVDESGKGEETCNFIKCPDGYVYGHVETIRGEYDTAISIERLGASREAESISQVLVVWVATNPQIGGRYVVGWYRDAEVFRVRQKLKKFPSHQHRLDGIHGFRIRAKNDDVILIPVENRTLGLKRGPGWMGQKNYWFPHSNIDIAPEIGPFLKNLDNLISGIDFGNDQDLEKIENDRFLDSTTKEALILARAGQGDFRKILVREWKACAVTGCAANELLRASHIKPWKDSDNRERLDHENGLLLHAGLDAAFDRGFISFSDDGTLLVSTEFSDSDQTAFGLPSDAKLRSRLSKARKQYLKYHRDNIFKN